MFPKIVVPQNGWLIVENPIKMDDLGVPLFLETPIYCDQYGITLTFLAALAPEFSAKSLHIPIGTFPVGCFTTSKTL